MNSEYLDARPDEELALYMTWFNTVCRWDGITPSGTEAVLARKSWYAGKAPRHGVTEMIEARQNAPAA